MGYDSGRDYDTYYQGSWFEMEMTNIYSPTFEINHISEFLQVSFRWYMNYWWGYQRTFSQIPF